MKGRGGPPRRPRRSRHLAKRRRSPPHPIWVPARNAELEARVAEGGAVGFQPRRSRLGPLARPARPPREVRAQTLGNRRRRKRSLAALAGGRAPGSPPDRPLFPGVFRHWRE